MSRFMSLIPVLVVVAALCLPSSARPEEPAKKLELFAAEDWYKNESAKEVEFTGTLRFKDRQPGPNDRVLPFYLEMKDKTRFVYVVKKEDIKRLKPYVDKHVQITGKAVDVKLQKTQHEIWPARLKLVPEKK
jgi:hypothetical protein